MYWDTSYMLDPAARLDEDFTQQEVIPLLHLNSPHSSS